MIVKMGRSALLSVIIIVAATAHAQVSYHIQGTWAKGSGEKVYLEYFPSKTPDGEKLDSTVVDTNGHFALKGQMAEPQLLMLTNGRQGYCPLMGDGKPVTVDIADIDYDYHFPTAAYVIKGDTLEHKAANAILEYWKNDFLRKMSGGMTETALKRAIANHNAEDSTKYTNEAAKRAQDDQREKDVFLQTYGNTLAAPFFIEMNMIKEANVTLMSDFYSRMGDKAKLSAKGQQLKHDIDIMARLSPGALAPDFTLADTAGNALTLSNLRGHVVLIDFWASWCVPCMAEMPTLKDIYAKYNGRGLKVLGVSMDHVRNSWLRAIEKKQLPWLHVSSLKGMQKCPVAELYQVHGIPQLYIIGPDGRIIAKNLRGEELKAKMDEVFATLTGE